VVVEALNAVDINDILYKCTSKLGWLEEAWYCWVIADEMAWISDYERAAVYVRRSLRWLKRILQNPSKCEDIREHVEWLVKEIESISEVNARTEGMLSGLTPRFRYIFYELLVRCILEEVQGGRVFKPPH
jgi:hypothetical protein